MSHLCGLCLTLRDEAGQASRALTGYDVLLLSVLVEAQAGRVSTERAGPCPLRGMRTAEVLPATDAGIRLAAAAGLLVGHAAVEDKITDGDLPAWTEPVALRVAARAATGGRRLAGESGLDPDLLRRAGREAAATEDRPGATLDDLLSPAGRAVAALFAHTAVVAARPRNEVPLWQAGYAFGQLVHLLDAVDDFQSDRRHGRFNPLLATGTPPDDARRAAERLLAEVHGAYGRAELADPELADVLLGPVLDRAVARRFAPGATGAPHSGDAGAGTGRPRRLAGAAAAAAATLAAPAVMLGIFGGRRPPRGYYDPYGPPGGYGYRYRRRGPSCCDLLACDCCANMACADCCGGDDDCCFCCC